MIRLIIYVLALFLLSSNMKPQLYVCAFSSSIEQFGVVPTWSIDAVNATWNINAVKAPQFWNTTNYRGEGAVIAIIDNGVNYTLPDLDGNYLGGWDFVDNDNDTMPASDDYHGTACASIAVGEGDQTYVGVAPKAKYYALRVGKGLEWNITYATHAINWCLNSDHKADVISFSGRYYPYSPTWAQEELDFLGACYDAWQCGVVVVASTCNDWKNYPFYPAGFGYAIAVGGYTQGGEIPSFSNWGCNLVAPGGVWDVPALGSNGSIINFGGTSAAVPHVAGAVALLLSRYGKWDTGRYQADEVRQILRLSATPLEGYSPWTQGAGLLNCLDIINYRAYLNNSGFEDYDYWWVRAEPDDEASPFVNRYWWDPIGYPPSECWPGIDYFDSLEGDCHLNLSLTSSTPGQNVYAGIMQLADWFNLKAYGANRTTRELHTAFRTLTVKVGTCEKARIAFKISFNSTDQTKHIYYCWYARGSDTNTTDTCYYNLGTATNQTLVTMTRDIKQDFYNAFATQLTRSWQITSIVCEITINQTTNQDHISLLIGEICLYGNYTNRIQGDINWDGVVNVEDYVLLKNAIGSYPGHSKWNPNADLNSDLVVNVKDLVLFKKYVGNID